MLTKNRTVEDCIIDAYIRRRQNFTPGYRPNFNKTGSDWTKAAQMVEKLGADPDFFVEAQFEGRMDGGGRFPFPAQLHDSRCESVYQDYSERSAPDPVRSFDTQMMLLNSQFDEISMEEIDKALSSPILGFKSWFRLLLCSNENLPWFTKVFREAALRQVRNNPKLRNFIDVNYARRANRFL